jgi:hypothetical protein
VGDFWVGDFWVGDFWVGDFGVSHDFSAAISICFSEPALAAEPYSPLKLSNIFHSVSAVAR